MDLCPQGSDCWWLLPLEAAPGQSQGGNPRVTESNFMSFHRYEPRKSAPLLSCIQSHQTPLGFCNKPETFSTEDYTWQRIEWPREEMRRSKDLSLLFAEGKGCKLCAITVTFSHSGFLGSSPCVKAFENILQWKKIHVNNPKSFPAETQTTTITLRCEFFLLP